jgi:hypothetical protein
MTKVERIEKLLEPSRKRLLHPDCLRDIIRLSTRTINKWSPQSEEIQMMVAAHESFLGLHLKQIGGGPARGLYGMELATERDIWRSYLSFKPGLVAQIRALGGPGGPDELHLTCNYIYATIMCRIKLLQCPGPLPAADNVPAMAQYATSFYNGGGKATVEKYINDYKRLVLN